MRIEWRKWATVIFGLALVACTAWALDAMAAFAVGGVALAGGGGFGFRRPVAPKTYDELKAQSEPWAADTPAADPWIEYDVQSYDSGVTTRLTFFQQTQANASLSNIEAGGVLPFPTYLEIHGICFDAYPGDGTYASTAAGGVGGVVDDIGRLIHASLASWTFQLAGKSYGPFPLAACSGLSAPGGHGYGTFTAEESIQFGTNGPRDMGFFVGGAWIIPPQQSYNIVVEWPAAVTLTQGDYDVRFALVGTKYRKVS